MYRIYFDTNSGDQRGRYSLALSRSLRDIEPIKDQLRDGMKVVIYMEGELEMEATLEFDPAWNCWMATEVEGTVKYLDGSQD